MTCEDVREARSARLDGEEVSVASATLDAHAGGCPAGRVSLARAEHVTRLVRVQPGAVPDLTAPVLAAVAAGTESVVSSRSGLGVAGGSGRAWPA
ncbi:hypothetical protein QTQ03_25135 [Micromonospora sp. WMMA1363]|uniref:hypothetical protein n=1 Tax=Micromonospora sp. WMMA1363 TaxID=3053985 RepID=UPI00259D113A|nr:hypothetical protein [Micromonospora sp. WMMA1363]MDM4722721.1 hypothetical protein [Micromonospora sp. WMMA1363]